MSGLGITGQRPVQPTPIQQAAGGPEQRTSERQWAVQFAAGDGARLDGVLHTRSRALSQGNSSRMNSRPGSVGSLDSSKFDHEVAQIMAWVGSADPEADAPLRVSLQRYLSPRGQSVALPALGRLHNSGSAQPAGRVQLQATLAFAIDQGSSGRTQPQP